MFDREPDEVRGNGMSDELIEKLKALELPMRDNVQSLFDGTCAAKALVEQSVIPLITGMMSRNEYEEAVAGVYFRVGAWLKSLAELKQAVHVQAVLSAARSLFELWLDVKLLVKNPGDAGKFHAFVFVERFRVAKAAASFADREYPDDASKADYERQFVNDPGNQAHLTSLCTTSGWWDVATGKPKWPNHWSGIANTADIARSLGTKYEEIYQMYFRQWSWSIHAGAAGLGRLSAKGIEAAFGQAHELAQDMVYDATEEVASTFRLFDADPTLREKLRGAKEVMPRSLVEASMRILEAEEEESDFPDTDSKRGSFAS